VPFLSFAQHCLFVAEWLRRPRGCRLVFREGSKLCLFAIRRRFGVDGGKGFFFDCSFSFELVSLYLDEHLLFHGEIVLFGQFLILLLVLALQGAESFDVFVQFLFVALDALVVHLVEIALLEQFVIGCLGLLRQNHRLLQLVAQLLDLILQDFVLNLCVGHLLLALHALVPLLLERVQCLTHALPREEVADVVIDDLQPSHVFRLVVLHPRLVASLDLGLAEGAPHQSFELLDVLEAVLEVIEVVHVLHELLSVRVAAYLHLLHHVDVRLLLLAHSVIYYAIHPSPMHTTAKQIKETEPKN